MLWWVDDGPRVRFGLCSQERRGRHWARGAQHALATDRNKTPECEVLRALTGAEGRAGALG